MAIPAFIFRTYSKQSAGVNDGNKFEAVKHVPGEENKQSATDGAMLEKALKWKQDANIPYIFWSTSFLFALLYALSKHRQILSSGRRRSYREQDIKIICLRTDTAKTCQGEGVTFEYCTDLVQRHQVPTTAGYHQNDVACKGCVRPGTGSYILSIDPVQCSKLYKLYPRLQETREPDSDDFRKNSIKLGDKWFRRSISLTQNMVETAALIASTARCAFGRRPRHFPRIVFAALLSIQQRHRIDPVLMEWIEKHKIGQFDTTRLVDNSTPARNDVAGLQNMINLLSCWEGFSYTRSGSKKARREQRLVDSQQTESQKTDSQEVVSQDTDSQAMSNDDEEKKVEGGAEILA